VESWGEDVGDGREEEVVLCVQGPTRADGQGSQLLMRRAEEHRVELLGFDFLVRVQEFVDRGGRRVVVRDGPRAPQPVDAAEPAARLGTVEFTRDRRENTGHHRSHRMGSGECGSNLRERGERARNGSGRALPYERANGETSNISAI